MQSNLYLPDRSRMSKYYAVVNGRRPGIYSSWDGWHGAKEQVNTFPNAKHHSFATLEEAQDYMRSNGALLRAAETPLPPEWKEHHTKVVIKANKKGWIMKVISYWAVLAIAYFSLIMYKS